MDWRFESLVWSPTNTTHQLEWSMTETSQQLNILRLYVTQSSHVFRRTHYSSRPWNHARIPAAWNMVHSAWTAGRIFYRHLRYTVNTYSALIMLQFLSLIVCGPCCVRIGRHICVWRCLLLRYANVKTFSTAERISIALAALPKELWLKTDSKPWRVIF